MKPTKNPTEEINIKDIPNFREMFGVKQDGSFKFSPSDLFDQFMIPEEYRYTFTLKPITAKQKYTLEGYLREISIQGVLWAKKNGIDISQLGRGWASDSVLKRLEKEGLDPVAVGYHDPKMDEDTKIKLIADKTAFLKKVSSLESKEKKYDTIKISVIGLNNYHHSTGEKVRFKKVKNTEYIDQTLWDSIPDKVRESVYQELILRANLTNQEISSL